MLVQAEGYTRLEMTFDGNVNVRQFGHAILHLDRFDEDYLIPMPDARVKGFLSGCPYPELHGTYHIVSSTGFVTEIRFSGEGFFSGTRNSFEARVYRRDDREKSPLYIIQGQWNGKFTIQDCSTNAIIDTWDADLTPKATLEIEDTDKQDSWESRRAWKPVIEALKSGNMRMTIAQKSKIEEAQRSMRKREAAAGIPWNPIFFYQVKEEDHKLFRSLAAAVSWKLYPEKTKGVWKIDREKAENPNRPFHGQLQPSE